MRLPPRLNIRWPWQRTVAKAKTTKTIKYTRSDGKVVEYEREVNAKEATQDARDKKTKDAKGKRRGASANVPTPTLKNNPLSDAMLSGDKKAFASSVLEQAKNDPVKATALVNAAIDDFASDLEATTLARMGVGAPAKERTPRKTTRGTREKAAKREGFGGENKGGFSGGGESKGFASGGEASSFEDAQQTQDANLAAEAERFEQTAADVSQLALSGQVSLNDMATAISEIATSPEQAQELVASITENMRSEMLEVVSSAQSERSGYDTQAEKEKAKARREAAAAAESVAERLDAAETRPVLNDQGKFNLPLGISRETANETIAIVDSITNTAQAAMNGTLSETEREQVVNDITDVRAFLFDLDGMTPNNVLGAVEASDFDDRMKRVASELLGSTLNTESFIAVADHLLDTLAMAIAGDPDGDPEMIQATLSDIRELARAYDPDRILTPLPLAVDTTDEGLIPADEEAEMIALREVYDKVLEDSEIVAEMPYNFKAHEYIDVTGLSGRDASTLAILLNRWNGPGQVFTRDGDGKRRLTTRIQTADLRHPLLEHVLDREKYDDAVARGEVETDGSEMISRAQADEVRQRKARERYQARKARKAQQQAGDETTTSDSPAADDGPTEGDTKVENGVTYVFTNGRWRRASDDEVSQQRTGAADEASQQPAPNTPEATRERVRSQVDFAPAGLMAQVREKANELAQIQGLDVRDVLEDVERNLERLKTMEFDVDDEEVAQLRLESNVKRTLNKAITTLEVDAQIAKNQQFLANPTPAFGAVPILETTYQTNPLAQPFFEAIVRATKGITPADSATELAADLATLLKNYSLEDKDEQKLLTASVKRVLNEANFIPASFKKDARNKLGAALRNLANDPGIPLQISELRAENAVPFDTEDAGRTPLNRERQMTDREMVRAYVTRSSAYRDSNDLVATLYNTDEIAAMATGEAPMMPDVLVSAREYIETSALSKPRPVATKTESGVPIYRIYKNEAVGDSLSKRSFSLSDRSGDGSEGFLVHSLGTGFSEAEYYNRIESSGYGYADGFWEARNAHLGELEKAKHRAISVAINRGYIAPPGANGAAKRLAAAAEKVRRGEPQVQVETARDSTGVPVSQGDTVLIPQPDGTVQLATVNYSAITRVDDDSIQTISSVTPIDARGMSVGTATEVDVDSLITMPQGASEGDTKTIDGVTYILRDKRWRLMNADEESTDTLTKATEQAALTGQSEAAQDLDTARQEAVDEDKAAGGRPIVRQYSADTPIIATASSYKGVDGFVFRAAFDRELVKKWRDIPGRKYAKDEHGADANFVPFSSLEAAEDILGIEVMPTNDTTAQKMSELLSGDIDSFERRSGEVAAPNSKHPYVIQGNGDGTFSAYFDFDPETSGTLKQLAKAVGGRANWNKDNGSWDISGVGLDVIAEALPGYVARDDATQALLDNPETQASTQVTPQATAPAGVFDNDGFPTTEYDLKTDVEGTLFPDQVRDVKRIMGSKAAGKRGHILANGTGTGKTYDFAAVMKESAALGESTLLVVPNKDTMAQTQAVLEQMGVPKDSYLITTHASFSKDASPGQYDNLVVDEFHKFKKAFGSDRSKRGQEMQKYIQASGFTLGASATPFETVKDLKYMSMMGMLPKGSKFNGWITDYGVEIGTGFNNSTTYEFVGTPADLKRLNSDLIARGFMQQRSFTPPEGMVSSSTPLLELDPKYTDAIADISAAIDGYGWGRKYSGLATAWLANASKRILETAKVESSIPAIREQLEQGRSVAVFTQYKSGSALGDAKKEVAPGDNVFGQMLDSALSGISIELPSPTETLREAFSDIQGGVAMYTGNESQGKLKKAKDDFNSGKTKLMVLTAAKGGTGLSFHDTEGGRPTTQVIPTLPWSAQELDQMLGRTIRNGLASDVNIILPTSDNSTDRKLSGVIAAKMQQMGIGVKGAPGVSVSQDAIDAFTYNMTNINGGDNSNSSNSMLSGVEINDTPTEQPGASSDTPAPVSDDEAQDLLDGTTPPADDSGFLAPQADTGAKRMSSQEISRQANVTRQAQNDQGGLGVTVPFNVGGMTQNDIFTPPRTKTQAKSAPQERPENR